VGDFSPRIPLLIRDPRKPPRGIVDQVVRSIDLAPTLLELAGTRPAPAMEGVSLTPCFSAHDRCPHLDAFNETGMWIADVPGLPDNHLRYPHLLELMEVTDHNTGTLSIKPEYCSRIIAAKDRMIRSGQWKLVYQPLTVGYLLKLFDVESDPGCLHDLSSQHPDIAESLLARLIAWMDSDAPLPPCAQPVPTPMQH
jgi:arylsulfatase A-like enzyme